eukprot:2128523-Amphidinium_carterae.1
MVAEHNELHNELAARISAISSSSAQLHTTERVNPRSRSVGNSPLAVGPLGHLPDWPRLG